jgi:hypothetical protein
METGLRRFMPSEPFRLLAPHPHTDRPRCAESLAKFLPAEVWEQLAESIQRAHQPGVEFRGFFHVEHGTCWFARLLARFARLPPAGEAVEVRLFIVADAGRELWQRSFGGHPFHTTQWLGDAGQLVEQSGAVEVHFRLRVIGGGLRYEQIGTALRFWSIRLALPRWLAPHVEAFEEPLDAQRVRVRISVKLPFAGLLIAYEGEVTT